MKKIFVILICLITILFDTKVYAGKTEFVKKEQTVYVGSTTKLETVYISDGNDDGNDSYTIKSSDESIATVKFGSLKALKAGKVTISIINDEGLVLSKTEITILEEGQIVEKEPEDEKKEEDENQLLIIVEGYDLDFDKNKHNYNLMIGREKKLNITVKPSTKILSIIGNKNLENGSVITIVVSGIRKPYTINIQKKENYIIYFIVAISILLFLNIIRMIIKNKKKKNY